MQTEEMPLDKEMEERQRAFERLESLRRSIPDFDEKKELAEYRDEKYGK